MAERQPDIGDRVRFAPNPRWPDRMLEARVAARRPDARASWCRARPRAEGWFDTIDDAGALRSVRPSRCTLIERSDFSAPVADWTGSRLLNGEARAVSARLRDVDSNPTRGANSAKASAGNMPANHPNSDAPAPARAAVSVDRPIGPLAPGTQANWTTGA